MYVNRKAMYQELEQARNSKVLVYVTGDRPGLETRIASEVYDLFVNQLDKIGITNKISLYLYTRGGDTLAAWSIINLIKQFADEIEVIVPSKCHSAGTLMALGANNIIMTKQATLGPIDPSINDPLNPQIPGAAPDAKVPVSVEDIKGFIELAVEECKMTGPEHLKDVMSILSNNVHPLVLGRVFRAKSQIQMLATKLIKEHIEDESIVERIVKFLCSESGSHDYTIHRREARNSLGMLVEKPDDVLYAKIKNIYDDIENELALTSRFEPNSFLGTDNQKTYGLKRCLLESVEGGSHYYVSEGVIRRQQIQPQPGIVQQVINDNRSFEGWKYETP